MMMQMVGAFAEFERAMLKERTKAGLDAAREEGRIGKLRIFVGAAPGVGKTYEMLQQAHARKKDGYDVVVGIVETHGRRETEALRQQRAQCRRVATRPQHAHRAGTGQRTKGRDIGHHRG